MKFDQKSKKVIKSCLSHRNKTFSNTAPFIPHLPYFHFFFLLFCLVSFFSSLLTCVPLSYLLLNSIPPPFLITLTFICIFKIFQVILSNKRWFLLVIGMGCVYKICSLLKEHWIFLLTYMTTDVIQSLVVFCICSWYQASPEFNL